MVWFVDDAVRMARLLVDVAFADPLSALLVALGALLVVFSSAVFGWLTLGALASLVTPDSSGRAPPQRG